MELLRMNKLMPYTENHVPLRIVTKAMLAPISRPLWPKLMESLLQGADHQLTPSSVVQMLGCLQLISGHLRLPTDGFNPCFLTQNGCLDVHCSSVSSISYSSVPSGNAQLAILKAVFSPFCDHRRNLEVPRGRPAFNLELALNVCPSFVPCWKPFGVHASKYFPSNGSSGYYCGLLWTWCPVGCDVRAIPKLQGFRDERLQVCRLVNGGRGWNRGQEGWGCDIW